MPNVLVTGDLFTNLGIAFPVDHQVELWFVPDAPVLWNGDLVAGIDARAVVDPVTGEFAVRLFAAPGLLYKPVVKWQVSAQSPVRSQPRSRQEWPLKILPYPSGGRLEDLAHESLSIYTVLVQLAPPPPGYKGWYLNAPGPGEPVGDPDDPASSGTGILEIVS